MKIKLSYSWNKLVCAKIWGLHNIWRDLTQLSLGAGPAHWESCCDDWKRDVWPNLCVLCAQWRRWPFYDAGSVIQSVYNNAVLSMMLWQLLRCRLDSCIIVPTVRNSVGHNGQANIEPGWHVISRYFPSRHVIASSRDSSTHGVVSWSYSWDPVS